MGLQVYLPSISFASTPVYQKRVTSESDTR